MLRYADGPPLSHRVWYRVAGDLVYWTGRCSRHLASSSVAHYPSLTRAYAMESLGPVTSTIPNATPPLSHLRAAPPLEPRCMCMEAESGRSCRAGAFHTTRATSSEEPTVVATRSGHQRVRVRDIAHASALEPFPHPRAEAPRNSASTQPNPPGGQTVAAVEPVTCPAHLSLTQSR